ncbi:MAG: helix-turn-helix transcriptional regulator [Pseudomonadota bacterium]
MEQQLNEQHRRLWQALDLLAAENGLSPSGLAKSAGLDATAFNPSKRVTRDGRLRWPGAETLVKVMAATGARLTDIAALAGEATPNRRPMIRLVGVGETVETRSDFEVPVLDDPDAQAIEIATDAYQPQFRLGDTLLVSPEAPLTKGDRIALRSKTHMYELGEILALGPDALTLSSFGSDGAEKCYARSDVSWIGRIISVTY